MTVEDSPWDSLANTLVTLLIIAEYGKPSGSISVAFVRRSFDDLQEITEAYTIVKYRAERF